MTGCLLSETLEKGGGGFYCQFCQFRPMVIFRTPEDIEQGPIKNNGKIKMKSLANAGLGVMEATPPATPRHTMFPLWLLPSGSDQVHG